MGFWGFGAIMMYGAGMGDSDHHTPVNLPTVLAGGGAAGSRGDVTCSTRAIRR